MKKTFPCDMVPSGCRSKYFPMHYVYDDCDVCLVNCCIFLLCVLGLSILYYLFFILKFNAAIGSDYRYKHICCFAKTITVKAGFGNDIEANLVLQEYPFLASIIVEKNSLSDDNIFVLSGLLFFFCIH